MEIIQVTKASLAKWENSIMAITTQAWQPKEQARVVNNNDALFQKEKTR